MSTTLPEEFNDLSDDLKSKMKSCMKKQISVRALQLTEDFRVESMEGNYKQGKAGDYLMCGIQGELYICDKEVFEQTYDWV